MILSSVPAVRRGRKPPTELISQSDPEDDFEVEEPPHVAYGEVHDHRGDERDVEDQQDDPDGGAMLGDPHDEGRRSGRLLPVVAPRSVRHPGEARPVTGSASRSENTELCAAPEPTPERSAGSGSWPPPESVSRAA